jgi:hypothetical protein
MGCSASSSDNVIDPDRMNFLALLAQLRAQRIKIERYNLVHEPVAFAQNEAVKALMSKEGIEGLPVIFWDGAVHLTGRYPTQEERAEWVRAACTQESADA